MPKEFSRTRRVAELVHRELATLISQEIKDPRIRTATVTAVEISPDLRSAKVYVTQFGADEAHAESLLAPLRRAAGFLRRRLGEHVELKRVPMLHFYYDSSVERGIELSRKIDATVKSDQERHKDD